MTTRLPPIALLGRGLAAIGAVLMIVSLFVSAYSGSPSFWEFYRRADVVILVLAVIALLLVLASLTSAGDAPLFFVGTIGGFGVGYFLLDIIEFGDFGDGRGVHLAWLGSAAVLVGAAMSLIPTFLQRSGQWESLAFTPSESTPAPETSTPAGWYADPSGQTRLRYWDGQAWTDQTQE